MPAAFPLPKVATEYFPLVGGLNLEASTFRIMPGEALSAQNYEAHVNGGYRRIYGYERCDGRAKPSDASYWTLPATVTGSFSLYDTVTGLNSGSTGKWLKTESGYIVLTAVSAPFVSGEELRVGGVTQATSTAVSSELGASTLALDAEYLNRAADYYRSLIQTAPGTGITYPVALAGTLYVFRGTGIAKATTGGWVAVPLGEEVAFTNANTSVGEGDTLTQGGVTATIKRVVVQTGTLASGVNTGRLIIHTRAGGNFGAGAATSTGGGSLTLDGAQSTIAIAGGGRYEFDRYNFGVAKRIYGCDGVNRGFEFDGTDYGYVPIATGMTTDTPNHVRCHKKHLFFSFGPSLQHSGIADQYKWTVVSGAAELNAGDTITNLMPQGGDSTAGAMALFTRNTTQILYGSSSSDWVLNVVDPGIGALAYTVQNIGRARYLDDRGICDLAATQVFGNFQASTISRKIQKLVDALRGLATASSVVFSQNQYRVYFSDKRILEVTFQGNKVLGIMPLKYEHVVRSVDVDEDQNGAETVYFGSDDGYVYQAEKGTSFDGADIEAYLRLAFAHSQGFNVRKAYRNALIEVTGANYAELKIQPDFSFGDPDVASHRVVDNVLVGEGATWGIEDWGTFVWGGTDNAPIDVKIDGTGVSMDLLFYSKSDQFPPHIMHGVGIHYIPRRLTR